MVGNVYGRAIMDFMIGDNVVAGCKNVFEKISRSEWLWNKNRENLLSF